MSKVFLLPGLGADCRIFRHIDLQGHDVVNVVYIEPGKWDTLATYAEKLIGEYKIVPYSVVIGNSLGGMLAMEIAKKVKLSRTILISSIKTAGEAPKSFKWFRFVPLYRIIPSKWITSSGFIVKFAFGKMTMAHQELFINMLENTPPEFAKWAIGAILHWDNKTIPSDIYQIAGDKDLMFPVKNIKGATILKGGTHIMIFNKFKEINTWLKEILPA